MRESGQIEQDADAIFLMHNLTEDEDGSPTNPFVEINMPAYRHGPNVEPAYLDKTGGKIKDAEPNKIASAIQSQNAQAKPSRPTGFTPGGFSN